MYWFDRLNTLNRPWPFIFIGWDRLIQQKNPITDLNLQRVLVVLRFQVDRSDSPVRPVGVARQATRPRPIRPLAGTGLIGLCQFWSLAYAPLFFGDASMPKNKPLDQNCLQTNMHQPYFILRAINSIGHILLLFQDDDEITCLGLYTCFMVADLAGTTSACLFHGFLLAHPLQPPLLGVR